MNTIQKSIIALISVVAMLGAFGCGSTTGDPVAPTDLSSGNEICAVPAGENGRVVMAAYHVEADLETGAVDALPIRDGQRHYNISKYIEPEVKFPWSSWVPSENLLIFDMELFNPSKFTAYDVRVIYIPNPWSGNYLISPDDYTNHWNCMSDQWINGFHTYADSIDRRAFKPGYRETQQFWIRAEYGVDRKIGFDLIVECSFPGNCTDPYEICNQTMSGGIFGSSPATLTVEVKCHQGGPAYVWVNTWPLADDDVLLTHLGGDFWGGVITNENSAPAGTYNFRITADTYYGPEQDYTTDQLHDFITVYVH